MSKVYLGDAVYADTDGWHIVLTTEDGISVGNTIYLGPEVMRGLIDYAKALQGTGGLEGIDDTK